MDELKSPIILFIIVGAISFLIPYHLARQRTKQYKRGKRKFNALSNNLLQIKEHVSTETDRWPIYARPVLFTEIDHKAQIEFARVQQALNGADQILPEIQTIEEPETSEQFTFNDLINVPKNLKTISLVNQLIWGVNALEQEIQSLRNSLKSLRTDRQQVEKTRLTVEKSIEELRKRTEQINKRLRPLDVWQSIEAHEFSWVVSIADRCQFEAYSSIENATENEQGYIEHATADVFVNIGNFSLDSIELFLESQKISRRYELDTFFKLFKGATGFLQSIWEMEAVWSGWKQLKRVKPYIDQLPKARQEAEKSLRSFKNRQEQLGRLIDLLSVIDIEAEIKSVGALEDECTYYWYSYAERKSYWEKALGIPPEFPSTELNHLQTLLVSEINPQIDVDTVIKQSELLGLIKKIGKALELHDTIITLTRRLEAELSIHKEAQRIVNELLDSHGHATLTLAELKTALVDTSPDIADAGRRVVSDYQNCLERKRRIQGADFPELLDSVGQFIVDSGLLIKEHHSQLEELKANYKAFYQSIELLNNELKVYTNYIPKFDNQSLKLFDEAFHESSDILDEEEIEKYSWLRPSVNKMQAWIERTRSFIDPARDKYNAFERGKRQVENLLEQTKEEIENNKGRLESRWGWYKNEIQPRIKALIRAYDRERKDWERLVERNWVEYNINRALSKCDNLIKFCDGVLIDLTKAIERVNQRQFQLNGKEEAVDILLQRNNAKLSAQDKKDIKSLVTMAKKDLNYEFANKLLGYAHTMAMRRATNQMRNQITHIINVYSEGGNVFMDQVRNSGSIHGATNIGKFFKQKGRKRNEKKR